MRELALFAGAGGGILGGHLLGWRTVCAVEYDPYAIAVLCARQNDGVLPPFPIWDDIRTFEGTPWRGRVDVISGGFPCTDISCAGKGAGIDGAESGLWREMARVIGEVRPRFVFVENSPLLVSRGLARVLGDLAQMGYDARWCVLGADDAGAPHRRKRIWIVGRNTNGHDDDSLGGVCGRENAESGRACGTGDVPDAPGERGCSWDASREYAADARQLRGSAGQDGSGVGWWQLEPAMDRMVDGISSRLHGTGPNFTEGVGRVATGVPARVQRLKCIGNGQCPATAAMAWRILTDDIIREEEGRD